MRRSTAQELMDDPARARSWEEYRGLVAAAGIPGLRLERHPLFRVTLSRIG